MFKYKWIDPFNEEGFRIFGERVIDIVNQLPIVKEDKKRANYYNFYTGYKWGASERYAATFNSSILGVDETARIIADMAKNLSKK